MRAAGLRKLSLLIVAGVTSVTLAGSPAVASPPDPITDSTGYYVVVGEEVYSPTEGVEPSTDRPSPALRRGGSVSPMLLDPVDSLQCNVRNNANHMVTSYTAVAGGGFAGGTIRLFCGTSTTSGFKHIRDRHQADWAAKLTKYGLGGTWDDFMDFATRQSLAAPSRAVDQGYGKSCYTTPVQIRRADGVIAETFYPRVIISRNNTLVITSIPGGGC